jgi:hypothetical protein
MPMFTGLPRRRASRLYSSRPVGGQPEHGPEADAVGDQMAVHVCCGPHDAASAARVAEQPDPEQVGGTAEVRRHRRAGAGVGEGADQRTRAVLDEGPPHPQVFEDERGAGPVRHLAELPGVHPVGTHRDHDHALLGERAAQVVVTLVAPDGGERPPARPDRLDGVQVVGIGGARVGARPEQPVLEHDQREVPPRGVRGCVDASRQLDRGELLPGPPGTQRVEALHPER